MRSVSANEITTAVRQLCIDANYHLGDDVYQALKTFRDEEESPSAKAILDQHKSRLPRRAACSDALQLRR